MNTDELLRNLIWFHFLESNQVPLYKAQAAMAATDIDRRLFEKVAEIEETHVANTGMLIAEFKGKPVPFIKLSSVSGRSIGLITSLNTNFTFRTNIMIENRAMEEYQKLIARVEDKAVLDILWSNYLDESLHTEWFKARLDRSLDKVPLR